MIHNYVTIISKNMLPGLAWPGPGHGLARLWQSGACGEASGAALESLAFPVPMALGSLGFPNLRHRLQPKFHLAMAKPWPGLGQARPGNTFVELMIN